MTRISYRPSREELSEVVYKWAEEFFSPQHNHLNKRLKRKDLASSFFDFASAYPHCVTRLTFKIQIKAYCLLKGYDFNIDKLNADKVCYSDWKQQHPNESFIGLDDKSHGSEYFKVYSPDKEKELKQF